MYLIVILKNISNFLILKILNLDVNNALQTIYWINKKSSRMFDNEVR